MERKNWGDLSPSQRRGAIIGGLIQLALLAAALIDLRRRSEDEINGSKRLWTLLVFVNYIGPIAYFMFGRKR